MGKSIKMASLAFPTKKAAKDFFREIRDRYRDGVRLDPEDEACLRELVAIHPEAEEKVGVGIAHFTVERDAEFGRTRHFVIHRRNGSRTDVSFISAIDGGDERRDRFGALRRAIEEQVRDFRTAAFASGEELSCPLSGEPITREHTHVDHAPPWTFVRLVEEWLRAEALTLGALAITPPTDNQLVARLTDPAQLASWQAYHQDRAILRLLSPRGNLSDARRAAGR